MDKKYLNVSLPKLEQIDWNKICYCMILENSDDNIIYGVGQTIAECKEHAQKYKMSKRGRKTTLTFTKQQLLCGLDTGVRLEGECRGIIIIRKCDMKLYQYCKRFGVYNKVFYKDPYMRSDFVRYANQRKK